MFQFSFTSYNSFVHPLEGISSGQLHVLLLYSLSLPLDMTFLLWFFIICFILFALGALISSDGRNKTEISARIAQAKMTFQKMKTVLTNSHISIHTRKRTLGCYIEPILMYGCEAWTISKQAQKKLEAVEMWFLRRMMKISWMAKKSNDTVLKEARTSRALVNKIRTGQTTFFGHVMRREKLQHLITTGMMEGKRSRGKQREKMTDGLVNWLGAGKVVETRDCGIWKDMIANAIKHGTGWDEIVRTAVD